MFARFNWIDLVAVVLLVRLVYVGIQTGLASELVKLTALCLGILISFRLYQSWGDWIATRTFLTHEWASVLVMLMAVVVVYLVSVSVLRLIQKAATVQFAAILDKWGGAGAAVVRMCIIMSIGLVALQQLPSDTLRATIEERSMSGKFLSRVAPVVYDVSYPWAPRALRENR